MHNKANKLTIKDIAKLCSVSKSTISRVLNSDPKVRLKTREHILSVIEQYQFVPSKSARAMRGHRNKAIGIIMSRLGSSSENQAVQAILPLLYQHNFDPIIVESQFDSDTLMEHLNMLAHRQVDGIILFSFSQLNSDLLSAWQNKIVILTRPTPNYTSIYYNDRGIVLQQLNYLYQHHHRNIGFIGVHQEDETTGNLRYQAYLDFCHDKQLTANALLGKLNYQSGYLLAASIVQRVPTAVLCATDNIAIGFNKYLQEQNLIDKIQVYCIGNNPLLRFLFPKTRSVDPGYYTSGVLAVEQLLLILEQGNHSSSIIVDADFNDNVSFPYEP